ncbi:MAG: AarF/ABC1/UbiB kinase family protein [Thermomicrobiales bacterium]|nr:AarF/ABC1/UbiB kinase family protein [Thermomicrobiales bacterium]
MSARVPRHRRLRQIAAVLGRHGAGYLLVRFGLADLLPLHHGRLGHAVRDAPYTRPDHLRLALEELGTTAIKLGQILSTRADLLPPAYAAELAKLRDRVPPVPAATIRQVIEREFDQPIAAIFARFADDPLATASIGQVHTARLMSGEDVVVKVQKPGVDEQVEVDLRLLLDAARLAQRQSPLGRDYDLVAIAEEVAWTLRGELDYEQEGRNADAFRRQFAGNRDVVIPTVYWSRTTRRVLTMQRLTGVTIDDLESLDRLGIDRHDLALRSANLMLSEVFEHGFYHADPHPGNFLVQPDGAIGAFDFGMVGRIGSQQKLDLLDLMTAVVDRDAERAVDAFAALGVAGAGARPDALVRDVAHLLDRYVGRPLGDLRFAEVSADIFATARHHHLRVPAELVLLMKTLVMNEGIGRRLDPEFQAAAVAAPFARRVMRRRLRPAAWEPELRHGLADLARVGLDLPGALRRLVRQLDRGEVAVTLRSDGLDEPLRRLEAMVNRLAMSLLLAAFVVGSAVLMTVYHPGGQERWLGRFFALGLIAAAALGLWLLLAIWRGGRR